MNIHLYPSPIINESRIERMTEALASAGLFDRITIVGTQIGELPAMQKIDEVRTIRRIERRSESGTSLLAKIVKTRSWSQRVLKQFEGVAVTCVTCHSLAVLPLSVRLARRNCAKLVYEPHELETETPHCRGFRRFMMRRLEQKYIRHVDRTIVVCGEAARWYESRYSLQRVEVVRNIPSPTNDPGECDLRSMFGLRASDIIFIYSGGLFFGRRVEQFIRIFQRLPKDRHIIFMGFGALVTLVKEATQKHCNIHFLQSVPTNQVLSHLRGADVGLSGVENRSLSYYFSLPNKQFEYLHAGLGSVVPNFPEMSRLIKETEAGWIVPEDTDEAWCATLAALHITSITAAKVKARSAVSRYSLEKEIVRLVRVYRELGFPVHSD